MTGTPTPQDIPLPGLPHNPDYTSSHAIPRRADTLLRMLLDDFQKVWDKVWRDPGVDVETIARLNGRIVDTFGQIYLLAMLRHLAPHDADRVAAALADQWDGGDSLGEWVHQWRTELDAGKPLTLFFAGEDDQ